MKDFALPRAVAVCVGACVCGLIGRVMDEARAAQPSMLLGLSPFELLIVALAVRAIGRQGGGAAPPSAAVWPAALLLLIPSGAGAWAALALFSLAQSLRASGQARTGYLLFCGLGVSELWTTIGFKLASSVLLPADAHLVAVLLQLLGFSASVTGNVVNVPGGNTIVILITCATLHRIPLAMLAAVALAAPAPPREVAAVLARAAAGYVMLNMARLVAMGWSAESYAFMHDGAGAGFYDAAQTILIFLAARRGRA